jgi:hypothetical protein
MVFRSIHSILKGSDSDTNMINVLDKINIKDVNYLTKSNKDRKYLMMLDTILTVIGHI